MKSGSPTIALVMPSTAETPTALPQERLLDLLGRGWDAHLVWDVSEDADGAATARAHDRFLELLRRPSDALPLREVDTATARQLEDGRLRGRVHLGLADHGRWRARSARYLGAHRRSAGDNGVRETDFREVLIALGPDLVHFHSGLCALARVDLARALGAKVVLSFEGGELATAGLEEPGFYRTFWDGTDALQFSERAQWRRAIERGCPPRAPGTVIPPAVDAAFFEPTSSPVGNADGTADGRLRILSVGALDWTQGYEYALQALRLSLDRGLGCEYRIVGDGGYLDALAFARSELCLNGGAHLLGSLDSRELRRQMAWANVFLCPAVVEGVSTAVVQAHAMALPVVATEGSGLPAELAKEDGTGFVVRPRDPDALAQKLALLAADPDLRRRIGLTARAVVLERFTPEMHLARFDELYKQTLAGSPPALSQY